MKAFFVKIWPWLRNKYVLTIAVFSIWMLFFDQNNAVDRIKMSSDIRQLEKDREYYLEFLMKKPNEDVFVVIEEKDKKDKKARK